MPKTSKIAQCVCDLSTQFLSFKFLKKSFMELAPECFILSLSRLKLIKQNKKPPSHLVKKKLLRKNWVASSIFLPPKDLLLFTMSQPPDDTFQANTKDIVELLLSYLNWKLTDGWYILQEVPMTYYKVIWDTKEMYLHLLKICCDSAVWVLLNSILIVDA